MRVGIMRNGLDRAFALVAVGSCVRGWMNARKRRWRKVARATCAVGMCAYAASLNAQSNTPPTEARFNAEDAQAMQDRITKLEAEVSELKAIVKQLQSSSSVSQAPQSSTEAVSDAPPQPKPQQNLTPEDR